MRFRSGSISIYHFNLIVDIAWFSSSTQLDTLNVLKTYFREHPVVRTWRLLAIISMGCLLFSAQILQSNITWAGGINCPAVCLTQEFSTNGLREPLTLIVLLLILWGYITSVLLLFDWSRMRLEVLQRKVSSFYEKLSPESRFDRDIR